jgi:hypothetical protein
MDNSDEMDGLRERIKQLEDFNELQVEGFAKLHELVESIQNRQTDHLRQTIDLYKGLTSSLSKFHDKVFPESDGTDLGLPELKLIDPEAGQQR